MWHRILTGFYRDNFIWWFIENFVSFRAQNFYIGVEHAVKSFYIYVEGETQTVNGAFF